MRNNKYSSLERTFIVSQYLYISHPIELKKGVDLECKKNFSLARNEFDHMILAVTGRSSPGNHGKSFVVFDFEFNRWQSRCTVSICCPLLRFSLPLRIILPSVHPRISEPLSQSGELFHVGSFFPTQTPPPSIAPREERSLEILRFVSYGG